MWYVILLWVTSQKILDFSEIFCWCFFWSTMVGLGSESSFRIHQHLQEWDVFVQKNLLPALSLSDSILSFRSAVIMCIGEYRTSRDLHFIGRVNKILWHQDLCFAKVWVFFIFSLWRCFRCFGKRPWQQPNSIACHGFHGTRHKSLSTLSQCPLKVSILDFGLNF